MINFPNKIYTVDKSILRPMEYIMNNLPSNGMNALNLYKLVSSFIEMDEYMNALSCLYAINYIDLSENLKIIRTC